MTPTDTYPAGDLAMGWTRLDHVEEIICAPCGHFRLDLGMTHMSTVGQLRDISNVHRYWPPADPLAGIHNQPGKTLMQPWETVHV
jgi:hypothetical protein